MTYFDTVVVTGFCGILANNANVSVGSIGDVLHVQVLPGDCVELGLYQIGDEAKLICITRSEGSVLYEIRGDRICFTDGCGRMLVELRYRSVVRNQVTIRANLGETEVVAIF